MKTSTIIRRLAALSAIAGKTSVNIPVINGCSAFMPFSEEFAYDSCSEPITRHSKRFNHHRYNSSGKTNSSTPKCDKSLQTSEIASSSISERNFEIVYNRYCNKALSWEEYLHLVDLLIKAFQEQLENEPDNKRVAIELKKLKRSYRDSLEAFKQFQKTCVTPEMVPIEPEFSCCCLPDYAKHMKKKAYRDYDRRLTKSRKLARKNKLVTRNFFMRQIEIDSDEEIIEEAKEYVADYEKYSEAHAELIKAEKALSSPCVEEAAWAIHIGLRDDNPELISAKAKTIAEADKILSDYQKALARYESCVGLLDYPTDF